MGQRNGWSYESVNYLTSCFRAWFPMKIIHMVNRHLLILLTKFSRGTSLFLSIFLPARILISLQKKRNSIILARTWKGNIDSKKMASCWWDRNKWQYTISAYKRRDIMYGDERIKKKKERKTTTRFSYRLPSTRNRETQLSTSHCFLCSTSRIERVFLLSMLPSARNSTHQLPSNLTSCPLPPQQLNPILKHNKREKKYSPSEYYNEDNSIKRQSPLYIDLKSDLSRPINWNRLNSNIYERSAVNIERGTCLIPLNDRPSLQWGVITKSRKRKGLGSKGVLITSVLSLRSFARKKKKIGYRSLEGDTLVTSFDHRPRHF